MRLTNAEMVRFGLAMARWLLDRYGIDPLKLKIEKESRMAKRLDNSTLTVADGEQITLTPSEILVVVEDNVRAAEPPMKYVEELAQSIKANGQTMPVVVRPIDATDGAPRFKLFIGYQRYRAIMYIREQLGEPDYPVLARVIQTEDELGMNLDEQLKRRDLNPMDLAKAIERMKAEGRDGKEIGQRMGKTGAWVSKVGKFTSLRPHIQKDLQEGRITIAQGYMLNGLEDAEQDDMVGKFKSGEITTIDEARAVRKTKKKRDKRGRKENKAPSLKVVAATFEELARKPEKDEPELSTEAEWRRKVATIIVKFLAGDIGAGAVGKFH